MKKNSNVQENGKSVEIQNVKYVRILKDVGKARSLKKEKNGEFGEKLEKDKEKSWLTQKNAEKNWQKQKAGITLIALVITIIVLIILAGISITMISGQDGILTRAGNAKVLNDKATIEEKIKLAVIASYNDDGELTVENVILNIEKSLPNAEITGEDFPITVTEEGYSYEIDAEGNAKIAIRAGIKVGDYVNYVPDTAEAYASTKLAESITGSSKNTADLTQDVLNWQVLNIYDDGSMDLIGSTTNQEVKFFGKSGYNNGVNVLNDICEKLYSKSSKGIKARSVNISDIENRLTEEGIKERTVYNNGYATYGDVKEYNEENVEQTFYFMNLIDKCKFDLKGLSSGGNYWLASCSSDCQETKVNFGLTFVWMYYWGAMATLQLGEMYDSDGKEYDGDDYTKYVRPVVSLGADVKIEKCDGDNKFDNMHKIIWD